MLKSLTTLHKKNKKYIKNNFKKKGKNYMNYKSS